jgi:hypothetical protein
VLSPETAADITVVPLLTGFEVAQGQAALKGFDQPIRFVRLTP